MILKLNLPRHPLWRRGTALFLSFGLATLALLLFFGSLTPAQARTVSPAGEIAGQPPARPLDSNLTLAVAATTPAPPGDGSIVFNGDTLSYTITVQNVGGGTVTDVTIEFSLPSGNVFFLNLPTSCSPDCTVSAPICSPDCTVEADSQTIFTRGGAVTVVQAKKVKWQFSSLVAGDFPKLLKFAAPVGCQTEGRNFSIQPSAIYKHADNSDGFAVSGPKQSTVKIAPPDGSGSFQLSGAPAFCSLSGPIGGGSDMDWGDFDNDGDLDVVLMAGREGLFVYRNTGTDFELFWSEENFFASDLEGVSWGDFNNDGFLELVVSGDWTGTTDSRFPDDSADYQFTGLNYLYRLSGNQFIPFDTDTPVQHFDFSLGTTRTFTTSFTTNDGAYRTAVADFTGDGWPDLAASVYWGGCTVHLFKNKGGGGTDPFDHAPTAAFGGPGGDSYCLFGPPYQQCCSNFRVPHALAWGDYDNDGDPDLAVGYNQDPGTGPVIIRVFETDSTNTWVLTETRFTTVQSIGSPGFGEEYVYDLAWGDYDNDGDLDLAAGFGSSSSPYFASAGAVRVYKNNNDGNSFSQDCAFNSNAVAALDWVDVNGDGKLELVVGEGDFEPSIFTCNSGTFTFIGDLDVSANGNVLGLQGVDYDSDGDMDIAMTNLTNAAWLFSNTAPFLNTQPDPSTASFGANDVAWGDVNGNLPDLIYATTSAGQTKVYTNSNGSFTATPPFSPNPPANAVAMANFDGDTDLDAVFGLNGQNLIYLNSGSGLPTFFSWAEAVGTNTRGVTVVDVDQDNNGRPDLIFGNSTANSLYINQGTLPGTGPDWSSPGSHDTRAVAWGRYDTDFLPDFAAADTDAVRIYKNGGLNNFTLVKTLTASDIRDVAWGDYDNDGDLDLAFGNDGERDQIYGNFGSTASQVNLFLIWRSSDSGSTTGLAWGDYDDDGDQDLAVSRTSGPNGVYRNNYVQAPHLTGNFPNAIPLPKNPPYVRIFPPTIPDGVLKRTAPLTDPANLVIPISYRVYDPDGSRDPGAFVGIDGDQGLATKFEYSLDGGGKWETANLVSAPAVVNADRNGAFQSIQWKAGEDIKAKNGTNQQVSDNVRFRITVVQKNRTSFNNAIAGPTQRTQASAVSPPFRVRNTSCIWPENPSFTVMPSPPISPGIALTFSGSVAQFDKSPTTFEWNFGNNVISTGQIMVHSFSTLEPHVVTLTVKQDPCPVTRPDFITQSVVITSSAPTAITGIYMPIILKSGSGATEAPPPPEISPPETGGEPLTLELAPGRPGQVAGLTGESWLAAGVTRLSWAANPPEQGVQSYRIYRSAAAPVAFRLLAQVPGNATGYSDDQAGCGRVYLVTAVNSAGESLPSLASYYSPPCP